MILHFDCFAGICGDMTLGALVDLGVDRDALRCELNKLHLSGWDLVFEKTDRCGIFGTKATVMCNNHKEHDHRHYSDIKLMIKNSGITDNAKRLAFGIFERLAKAEAEVHGVSLDDVAFHEVGAVDSIIDIAGAAICIDILAPDRITASEVELGGGTVHCAHGILAVPAPATLKLVQGMPAKTGTYDKEMTTPTGAAILNFCVDEFMPRFIFKEVKSAYGIGQRKMDRANVLRVSLRETVKENIMAHNSESHNGESHYIEEELILMQTNIDDMTGEELGFLMEMLFSGGALDITFTPSIMKKSRPATIVSVLTNSEKLTEMRKIIFKHSSSIGIRETKVNRVSLPRTLGEIKTKLGLRRTKTVKVDEQTSRTKIEFDDLAKIAREHNISLREAGEIFTQNP
ncbi:MAG: nickel pincer cofactor biosynthesis protein LarC [Termitinemataceae bacterium]|nr:MAG: nickel pincer cofactor biosynthesis protein LarC [Termitinemataceae bacterium]